MGDMLDWLSDELQTHSREARRRWIRLFPAQAGELREWIALFDLLEWFFEGMRATKADPAFRAQLRADLMQADVESLYAQENAQSVEAAGASWRKWGVGSAAVVVAGALVWWRRSQSDAA
nr:hypothetical protein [Ardenticatena sp.]